MGSRRSWQISPRTNPFALDGTESGFRLWSGLRVIHGWLLNRLLRRRRAVLEGVCSGLRVVIHVFGRGISGAIGLTRGLTICAPIPGPVRSATGLCTVLGAIAILGAVAPLSTGTTAIPPPSGGCRVCHGDDQCRCCDQCEDLRHFHFPSIRDWRAIHLESGSTFASCI